MIRLDSSIRPDDQVLGQLAAWQAGIVGTFSERSELAKSEFSKRNKRGNPTFNAIKDKLTLQCSGARKCVYCEESVADEVEHIYPKDLFPDRVFSWENYVYACGTCNGPKRNKFAIFRSDNGRFQKLNPPEWPIGTEPMPGTSVMIDPRNEDPLSFAFLDLKDTFKYVALPGLDDKGLKRFEFTYEEVLRLNDVDREYLRRGREEAFGDYRDRVVAYAVQKHKGAAPARLGKLIKAIRMKAHPTVWKEIQRYHRNGWLVRVDADLDQHLLNCPELMDI